MSPSATSQRIDRCQLCDAESLDSVLYLGDIPPVNAMVPIGTPLEESIAYPLELVRCRECTLVQISVIVDADVLFPVDYPYRSASTAILRRNFADLKDRTAQLLAINEKDLVVDVGSNDGTLLSNFKDHGCRVLGVEPSRAADTANNRGIRTDMSFFDRAKAEEILANEGPARLVTAANVFAHMPNIVDTAQGIASLLSDDGVFVSESHYFPDLIKTLQYDTIYHEHLRYYSLRSVMRLLTEAGLEVFRAERIPTHGGSIRVYAARHGAFPVEASIEALLSEEEEQGITDGWALEAFRKRVILSKVLLYKTLAPIIEAGGRIYGVGAPSRASTLINYIGLDEGVMPYVLEIPGSEKLDRFVPGTRIPVVDEAVLFDDQPDFALLLSWHIADELKGNLTKKGFKGDFIVPLPEPRVIQSN